MRFGLVIPVALAVVVGFPSLSAEAASSGGRPSKPRRVVLDSPVTSTLTLDWNRPRRGRTISYLVRDGRKVIRRTKRTRAVVRTAACGRRHRLSVVAVGPRKLRSRRSKALVVNSPACPVSATAAAVPAVPAGGTLARLLADDMSLPSEVAPHGFTGDFAFKPRLGAGIDPGGYRAFTAWGQMYECVSGNPQPSARVQITSLEAWIKSRTTGAWSRVQATNLADGDAFVENYVGNSSRAADLQTVEGTTSVTAGGGYNFHFWPTTSRISINPNDIGGVITSFRARLQPGTYSGGAAPCYVLSSGADYWSTADSAWNNLQTNSDVGIGRFKRADANWRLFTMSTTSAGPLPGVAFAAATELR